MLPSVAPASNGSPQWPLEALMRIRRLLASSFLLVMACIAVLVLAACSVDVKNHDGEDKNVDIRTPIGGIHVSNDVDAKDTGLPVYPGARPAKKENDND